MIQEDDEKYKALLADLIERSKVAKTANEVSALVKYTSAWSAEQRTPLHEAIAKRLAELKANESASTQEAPAVNEIKSARIIGGLKIQIGNAQNITELEAVAKTI